MEEKPLVVEDFYGVYLLYCINPKYKGRTYIGYTRDPTRRIKQHNRGTWAGGAYRTSNRGPWKMVMIVHGFPNNISALRFEWAWQNPTITTRLQHLNLKRIPRKEPEIQFQLRVLSEMLRVGPWCRLPLTVRWLERDFCQEFPLDKLPPVHMDIQHGKVKSKNLKKASKTLQQITECLICSKYIRDANTKLTCLNMNCELIAHLACIAPLFLSPGEYIPIEGQCPFCDTKLKWGDLIRKMRGCSSSDKDNDGVCDEGEASDEDDDAVVCTQDKGFVDEPSWFLDCNEDL